MKRYRLSLAVLAALGLAACADQATVQQQGRELKAVAERVKTLEARLASREGVGTLEEQERCSRQAAVAYRDLGYVREDLGGYESHFNPKLGKCFVAVTNITSKYRELGLTTTMVLVDAFEMKQYAAFTQMQKTGVDCTLGSDVGSQQTCTHQAQYKAWIKPFMTE